MEQLHIRLREELTKLGLGPTEVAKLAGEKDSQGMRDVLSGRKRLPADLLGRIAVACPIDALYVMTGMRMAPQAAAPALSDEHKQLIDDYDGSSTEDREAIRQLARSVSRAAEEATPPPTRKRAAGGRK